MSELREAVSLVFQPLTSVEGGDDKGWRKCYRTGRKKSTPVFHISIPRLLSHAVGNQLALVSAGGAGAWSLECESCKG